MIKTLKKIVKKFLFKPEIKLTDFSIISCKKGINNSFQGTVYIDDKSIIGNHNYFGHNTSISKAIIGNYCSIATNVSIGMGEHAIDAISTSSLFYSKPLDILLDKDCKIGNDVWIGVDAVILRGITVGNGAIIGANSVVTKDIPDFAIAVGSPAKVIRYRFSDEEQILIRNSEWWDCMDLDTAKNRVSHLTTAINKRQVIF